MKKKTTTFDQLLDKEKCINFFSRYGYYTHHEDESILVLKKAGTVFTFSGKKIPMELTISFGDSETEISLKYDAYVLFDTGDLQRELDKIVNLVKSNISKLV